MDIRGTGDPFGLRPALTAVANERKAESIIAPLATSQRLARKLAVQLLDALLDGQQVFREVADACEGLRAHARGLVNRRRSVAAYVCALY